MTRAKTGPESVPPKGNSPGQQISPKTGSGGNETAWRKGGAERVAGASSTQARPHAADRTPYTP